MRAGLMQLTALTKENCEQVREWRNLDISIYRTSYFFTRKMQENFYNNVICNRNSEHRYWAVTNNRLVDNDGWTTDFIGMVGLTNISLENRNAELSIVINPELHKQGYGSKALELLLKKGFYELNLENIYGEAYLCNPNFGFWDSIIRKYKIYYVTLPGRKYWNGKYHDAVYFNFNKKIMEKM
jgi:RimJ/RimL family protein N-acetyltransferase